MQRWEHHLRWVLQFFTALKVQHTKSKVQGNITLYIFFCIYFYLVDLSKHLRGITLWYQQNDSLQSFHFKGGRHAACHPWLVIARSNQIPQWAIDHAKFVGHSKWNLIFSKIRQIIIDIESSACGLLKIPPIVVLCQ